VTPGEADPALHRFERDAVAACAAMACLALVLVAALGQEWGRAVRVALGVIGGGLLTGVSYRAIKGAANLLVEVSGGSAPGGLSTGRRAFLAVKFFTRFALLALGAYVMLTCFRLHPVGVVAGATSPFVAALMQTARMFRAGRQHP
jgi:hypothetical protein